MVPSLPTGLGREGHALQTMGTETNRFDPREENGFIKWGQPSPQVTQLGHPLRPQCSLGTAL